MAGVKNSDAAACEFVTWLRGYVRGVSVGVVSPFIVVVFRDGSRVEYTGDTISEALCCMRRDVGILANNILLDLGLEDATAQASAHLLLDRYGAFVETVRWWEMKP